MHEVRESHLPPGGVDGGAGEENRTQLVLEHLWLADALAGRYRGRGVEADDLQQVARCGLVEASHRFDPSIGAFGPFASTTITGVLKRHFRDHGWSVRPPRSLQQLSVQIGADWSAAAQDSGREPRREDFAARLGHPVIQIDRALHASQVYRVSSLDDERRPLRVVGYADRGFPQCESRMVVERLLPQLELSEQRLMTWRFWEDRTQAEIAHELGVSQMQASRLLSRTLTRLRELLATEPVPATTPGSSPRDGGARSTPAATRASAAHGGRGSDHATARPGLPPASAA